MMILEIDKAIKHSKVDLGFKEIGEEGLKHLCEQKCTGVREINLEKNTIRGAEMTHFASARWRSLVTLDLYGNELGPIGCKNLSRATLNALREINIGENRIQSEGLIHLSKAQWPALKSIYAIANEIGVRGAWWLVKGNWRKLFLISAMKNKLTFEEMRRLVLTEFAEIGNLMLLHNRHTSREEVATVRSYLEDRLRKVTVFMM